MTTNYTTINCEEEAIHHCGQIHQFGYLIILNQNLNCVSISENCIHWIPFSIEESLNNNNNKLFNYLNNRFNLSIETLNVTQIKENPITKEVIIKDKLYQLTIYTIQERLYFEFEENEDISYLLSQVNTIQTKIDHDENTWQALCDIIYQITELDRILIYKFQEDQTGIVIAEHNNKNVESVLGYRYPDFDIPAQARQLYLKNHFRQTPNIHAKPIKICGLEASDIDLSKSQIRALSPIHLQYLENFGAKASVSFSIIIDNKLWGFLACQHLNQKYISYNKKSLCLFITRYASNKYALKKIQNSYTHNYEIIKIEQDLKEKLLYNQSLEKTISQFAETLQNTLSADGFVIRFSNYIFRIGTTPNDSILNYIHDRINKEKQSSSIYTTHSLELAPYHLQNDIKGVARLSFDLENNNVIYWFRKEIYMEEKWAGIPAKTQVFSEEKQAFVFSPRTSFHIWTKTIKGQSEKWNKHNLIILERIHKTIQDAIVHRAIKIKQQNDQLLETNNKLEAFTHQLGHDIKNPLTAIKINAKLFQVKPNLTKDQIKKFSKSIIDSSDIINNIMEKTIESTKSTPIQTLFETIDIDSFIHQIIEEAIIMYKTKIYNLQIGELIPVYGDKTLVYQLFMNLIHNAVKFSSKKDSTCLEIYSEKDITHTTYYIKDNGIGIPENEIADVFNVFKRLSNADQFEGTGVGMSIVKRIIEKLNAEISMKSKINEGTLFIIKFQNEQ